MGIAGWIAAGLACLPAIITGVTTCVDAASNTIYTVKQNEAAQALYRKQLKEAEEGRQIREDLDRFAEHGYGLCNMTSCINYSNGTCTSYGGCKYRIATTEGDLNLRSNYLNMRKQYDEFANKNGNTEYSKTYDNGWSRDGDVRKNDRGKRVYSRKKKDFSLEPIIAEMNRKHEEVTQIAQYVQEVGNRFIVLEPPRMTGQYSGNASRPCSGFGQRSYRNNKNRRSRSIQEGIDYHEKRRKQLGMSLRDYNNSIKQKSNIRDFIRPEGSPRFTNEGTIPMWTDEDGRQVQLSNVPIPDRVDMDYSSDNNNQNYGNYNNNNYGGCNNNQNNGCYNNSNYGGCYNNNNNNQYGNYNNNQYGNYNNNNYGGYNNNNGYNNNYGGYNNNNGYNNNYGGYNNNQNDFLSDPEDGVDLLNGETIEQWQARLARKRGNGCCNNNNNGCCNSNNNYGGWNNQNNGCYNNNNNQKGYYNPVTGQRSIDPSRDFYDENGNFIVYGSLEYWGWLDRKLKPTPEEYWNLKTEEENLRDLEKLEEMAKRDREAFGIFDNNPNGCYNNNQYGYYNNNQNNGYYNNQNPNGYYNNNQNNMWANNNNNNQDILGDPEDGVDLLNGETIEQWQARLARKRQNNRYHNNQNNNNYGGYNNQNSNCYNQNSSSNNQNNNWYNNSGQNNGYYNNQNSNYYNQNNNGYNNNPSQNNGYNNPQPNIKWTSANTFNPYVDAALEEIHAEQRKQNQGGFNGWENANNINTQNNGYYNNNQNGCYNNNQNNGGCNNGNYGCYNNNQNNGGYYNNNQNPNGCYNNNQNGYYNNNQDLDSVDLVKLYTGYTKKELQQMSDEELLRGSGINNGQYGYYNNQNPNGYNNNQNPNGYNNNNQNPNGYYNNNQNGYYNNNQNPNGYNNNQNGYNNNNNQNPNGYYNNNQNGYYNNNQNNGGYNNNHYNECGYDARDFGFLNHHPDQSAWIDYFKSIQNNGYNNNPNNGYYNNPNNGYYNQNNGYNNNGPKPYKSDVPSLDLLGLEGPPDTLASVGIYSSYEQENLRNRDIQQPHCW